MSSDWQSEQTGVDRVAGDRVADRLTICAGSGFELKGLRSNASLILVSTLTNRTYPAAELNSAAVVLSLAVALIAVDCAI